MTGLLDFLKTPEGQGIVSGLFGYASGAQRGTPLNNIGRGGLAAMAGYSGAVDRQQQQSDNAFNQQYKQAQLDELKRKQSDSEKRDQFLQNLFNPGVAAMAAGAQDGDVGPTKTNAARMDAAPQALGGLPAQAVQADILLNGGKNLPEWMFKRGTPDMQVSGGFAFDKNSVKPGYMPQMSVSNDGKATQVVIGPDGSPMVVAPRGAVETYGAFRGVDEGTKANFDPMPITTPNGQTVMTTRRAVVEGARPQPGGNYQGSGYAGGSSTAAASDQRAILMRERDSAAKAGRAQDVAALDRELARLPGGQAVPGIQVQSEADKVAATTRAKADAEAGSGMEAEKAKKRQEFAINSAKSVISAIDDASNLIGQSTTGVGSVLSFVPGTSARNLSSKLETIKANLGFDRLQQMRDMSPTGGALGSVAVQELTALQSTVSSLDQGQSPEQLRTSLSKIKTHYENWKNAVVQANNQGGQSASWNNPQGNGKSSSVSGGGWSAVKK